MSKTARAATKVSREVFCKTWNTSESVTEVAKKLGMKPASAVSKASVLRKLGAKLKNYKQGRPRATGVEELNKILNDEPKPSQNEIMSEIIRLLRELAMSPTLN